MQKKVGNETKEKAKNKNNNKNNNNNKKKKRGKKKSVEGRGVRRVDRCETRGRQTVDMT